MAARDYGKIFRSATFMVCLPIAGALLLAFAVQDFIVFALEANFLLNLGILLVLLVAVFIGVMRGRMLDREMGVLRLGFSIVENRVPGSIDALPRNISGSMFMRLKRLGLASNVNLPDGTIDAEIETMRSGFEQSLEGLNYLVGLLIALGLLGTFIGLLETLIKAGDVLDLIGKGVSSGKDAVIGGEISGMFSQMVSALRGPLTAMGTAFSASMFGLVGSIIAGLMVVLLRRSFEAIVRRARFGLVKLSDASAATLKPVVNVTEEFLARFLTSLAEHNGRAAQMLVKILEESSRTYPAVARSIAAVQMLSERVERQSEMLARLPESLERLQRMPEAVDAATQQLVRLNASIAAQEKTMDGLAGRLQAQAAAQAQQTAQLRDSTDAQIELLRSVESSVARSNESGQRIASGIDALGEAQKPVIKMVSLIGDSLRGIESTQKPLLETVSRIGTQLEVLGRDMLHHQEEWLALVRAMRAPLADTMQSLSDQVRRSADACSAMIEGMPGATGRLEAGLDGIQQRMVREEGVLRAQSDLLQAALDGEEKRTASLRLLGDALLSSAGSVEGVRHEVAEMVRGQRQLGAQLSDNLKGVELVLSRMNELIELQQLALREGHLTEPGGK